MSTILGQTLVFALKDAVERQKLINEVLSDLSPAKPMVNEQTQLLLELLELCERVY